MNPTPQKSFNRTKFSRKRQHRIISNCITPTGNNRRARTNKAVSERGNSHLLGTIQSQNNHQQTNGGDQKRQQRLYPVWVDDPHPETQCVCLFLAHGERQNAVGGPTHKSIFIPIGVAITLLIVVGGVVLRWHVFRIVRVPMFVYFGDAAQLPTTVFEGVMKQRIHQNEFLCLFRWNGQRDVGTPTTVYALLYNFGFISQMLKNACGKQAVISASTGSDIKAL